jgi:hypothetical protein
VIGHGLEEVLAAIPRGRQLQLAGELNLPVVVRTPERDKLRVTRRALALLRETKIEPGAVLVDNANAQTLKTIRECGFVAGLSNQCDAAERRGGRRPDPRLRQPGAHRLIPRVGVRASAVGGAMVRLGLLQNG